MSKTAEEVPFPWWTEGGGAWLGEQTYKVRVRRGVNQCVGLSCLPGKNSTWQVNAGSV